MLVTIAIWFMYFASLYFIAFWLLIYLDKDLKEKERQTKRLPLVTICIPAFNEEENIAKTINSALALDYPENKREIICVNHGSTDQTGEIVKSFGKKIKVINLSREKNHRKGAAVNAGLARAKGDLFICLDADSYVKPNALKIMLPYFDEEDVASVLPVIKVEEKNTFMRKIQTIEYIVNFLLKKINSSVDCVHVTPGPFGAYKTAILRKIGGFDPENLTEDLEMALRLQKHNYKIIQLFNAEVLTTAPKNYAEFFSQRNRWYQGSILNLIKYRSMLFNKKYGVLGTFHMPMILVSASLSIFFAIFIMYNHMIRPLLEKLKDASYINFNIPFMMQKRLERFSMLDLNYTFLFFLSTLMLSSLIWIILGHKYANENLKKNMVFAPLYIFIYPFLMAIVWLAVTINLARRKQQQWNPSK